MNGSEWKLTELNGSECILTEMKGIDLEDNRDEWK